jgi:hypothetical protein
MSPLDGGLCFANPPYGLGRALVLGADKPGQLRLLGLAPGGYAEALLVDIRHFCRNGDLRYQILSLSRKERWITFR